MSLEKLKVALKNENHRITKSRLATYEILEKSQLPLSPKDLFEKATEKGVSSLDLVSVYRNLNLFAQLGLAHKVPNGKYSSCDQTHECDRHPHAHVILTCESCGKVFESDEHSKEICDVINLLKKSSSKKIGSISQVTVQGLCKKCH